MELPESRGKGEKKNRTEKKRKIATFYISASPYVVYFTQQTTKFQLISIIITLKISVSDGSYH